VTKFDVSTTLTSQVMDCQIHETGKAILFANLVTYAVYLVAFVYMMHMYRVVYGVFILNVMI